VSPEMRSGDVFGVSGADSGMPEADPAIHGRLLDAQGRCAHYRGPLDIVAIRFRCCGKYYACHACHDELESHASARWRRTHGAERVALCGACRAELTLAEYLSCGHRCPRCGAGFNPGCAGHRHLYFEL
jgi:uncharacterized CHY-type Zn-finger protein